MVLPAARCVVSDSRAQAGRFSLSPMIQVDTGSRWRLPQRPKKDHTQSGSQESSPLQTEWPQRGDKYQSPRIKALRAALDKGQANAVETFWKEIKEKGAPLIEPLEGNQTEMLVTFLWQGNPNTKNVTIMWFPCIALLQPDEYRLIRLGETNVWYKSLPVDKRKRFMYQLAENIPALRPSQDFPTRL